MSRRNDQSMSRRDFLKATAGTVAAVAVAAAVPQLLEPTTAFAAPAVAAAAPVPLAAGTYTITANLFADKKDTPIHEYAYLTNPGNPPADKPIHPVTSNATLTVSEDGKKLVTVPIVNEMLGLVSLASASKDGLAKVVNTESTSWETGWPFGNPQKTRISSATFDVTNFAGGSAVADFSPCEEYVKFFLYRGRKYWDLHLTVDFSSVTH